MIRIDEIYHGVFLPWLQTNRPGVKMFYCHPFGRTDVESLQCSNLSWAHEHNYILFFDQEPIDMARHQATFQEFIRRDLERRGHVTDEQLPILVTSEKNSAAVDEVCVTFGFQSRYYFFHGWAALDWYRGYNYSLAIIPPDERQITHTFFSPNRIIGGDRWHRVVMMYQIIKHGLQHNHISFPKDCPVEKAWAADIAAPFKNIYPDISDTLVLNSILPFEFNGESGHPMTSYCLDRFTECNQSLVYLVTETVARNNCLHLTEKTFKPIALGMPFVLLAPPGSLEYLRSYGFKTFSPFIDESYDLEQDIFKRIEMIAKELQRLDKMFRKEKQDLFLSMVDIVRHNHNHFYNGGFEKLLKDELQTMLATF